MERPKIGELLVAAGVIQPDVLESALEKQRAQGGRIGSILIGMGALDEEMLVRTVARQLDMPVAWLRGKQVKAEVLSQLPKHVALKHRCLPVMLDRKGPETLLVAMEDPSDAAALDEVAVAAGRPVRVVLAAPSELDDALARHYPRDPEPRHEPEREPEPEPEPAEEAEAEKEAEEEAEKAAEEEEEEEEEPELLLTDPLGETGGAPPEESRVAPAAQASPVDPLDLGGDYDPTAHRDDTPALDAGSDLDAAADPGAGRDLGAGADLDAGPDLDTSRDFDAGRDLDTGHDLDAGSDLDGGAALGPEPEPPGLLAAAPGDDLGLDLDAHEPARRAGDSLDDAIDEVRGVGAGAARERDAELAPGDEAPSLFGDDPLEVTLPPRPRAGAVLPRDAELRAVVMLLIERGLLSSEEVSARLQALGRDDDERGG